MTQQQRDALECEAGYVFVPMSMSDFRLKYGVNPKSVSYDAERKGAWMPPETMPLWQAGIVVAGIIGVSYLLHNLFQPQQ